METVQYLIAKILFETNILGDKIGILGLSVLSYSVPLMYPKEYCERQSCPAVVGATS